MRDKLTPPKAIIDRLNAAEKRVKQALADLKVLKDCYSYDRSHLVTDELHAVTMEIHDINNVLIFNQTTPPRPQSRLESPRLRSLPAPGEGHSR